MIICKCEVCL